MLVCLHVLGGEALLKINNLIGKLLNGLHEKGHEIGRAYREKSIELLAVRSSGLLNVVGENILNLLGDKPDGGVVVLGNVGPLELVALEVTEDLYSLQLRRGDIRLNAAVRVVGDAVGGHQVGDLYDVGVGIGDKNIISWFLYTSPSPRD